MRVLIIGLTKELPLSSFDAMDIADKLVARAANAHTSGTYECISNMLQYSIKALYQYSVVAFACFI